MKKVLFIADSLSVGGLEKSLVDLLRFFDYSRYQVDLYLISDGRALCSQLPAEVRLLLDSPYYHDYYHEGLAKSLLRLLKRGRPDLCFWRLIRAVKPRFFRTFRRNYTPDTPLDWRIKKKTMARLTDRYDVAIGYAEGMSIHYAVDCVDADVKLGWVHTDLLRTPIHVEQERRMLRRLDHLVTVSENSKRSILKLFPELEDKTVVLPNLLDDKTVVLPNLLDTEKMLRLSEEVPEGMDLTGKELRILSVGRLVELKGFHLLPQVCRLLTDAGICLHWYVVGEGEYRPRIEEEIRKWGVEERFTLLGNRENPYCYERAADICVQASSYEGRAVVIEEAKFFRKPIVVSDIPAFREVICHEENGLIATRTPEGLYEQLLRLCSSPAMRQRFSDSLTDETLSNASILRRIDTLMECKE